jgi:hypothetical protein
MGLTTHRGFGLPNTKFLIIFSKFTVQKFQFDVLIFPRRCYYACSLELSSLRRDGRVAEGAPLLREYGSNHPSRVRIPLSPPIGLIFKQAKASDR